MELTIISRKEAISKNMSFYFTGKECSKGHVANRYVNSANCVQCNIDFHAKRRVEKQNEIKLANKLWRENNSEYIYKKNKEWKEKNPEKVRLSSKKYYEKSKEKLKPVRKAYKEKTKEKLYETQKKWIVNNKEQHLSNRKQWRKSKENCEFYIATCSIRNVTVGAFTRKRLKKPKRTEELLGCSIQEAREYLQNKFADGMSWENHGEWHIDHIIPLASAKNIDELISLAHYKNLQPLWKIDNLKKGSKIDATKTIPN